MSEWTYLPLYLTSFLRKAQLSSQLGKYTRGSGVEIPLEEFSDFIFNIVWGERGLTLYPSREKLKYNLSLLEKLGGIKLEEGSKKPKIKISELQYKDLLTMAHTTLSSLKNEAIPLYSKECIRRAYLASQLPDSELLRKHDDQLFNEVDAGIIDDFYKFSKK